MAYHLAIYPYFHSPSDAYFFHLEMSIAAAILIKGWKKPQV